MSTFLPGKRKKPELRYDSLEPRNLLAGVVSVDLYAQDLFIRGDRFGNEVSISLDPELGTIIEGGDETRVEFSKNASDFIDPNSLNSIFVFMGSGDDVVAIDAHVDGGATGTGLHVVSSPDVWVYPMDASGY